MTDQMTPTANEIDPEYIGQVLIEQGFEVWFRYMFRTITNKPFVLDPIHSEIFTLFQDIFDGKLKRVNINICPRSHI